MIDLQQRVREASLNGMLASVWAALKPDDVALYDPYGARTFRALNEAANRIVRLLRDHGVKAGDAIALLASNRAEFCEVLLAAKRGGYRLTPVNWHLNAEETHYVITDCDARALFGEVKFPAVESAARNAPALAVKIAIGGDAPAGFLAYEAALARYDGADIPDPQLGGQMLYTSGTTGRPKGVYRDPAAMAAAMAAAAQAPAQPNQGVNLTAWIPGEADRDVQLGVGPAYHAAPLLFDVNGALNGGYPLVFLDKWDTEEVLRVIQERKITRAHLVPIMFQRLLAAPEALKRKYDLSSLRYIIHGAAPCPPEVKRAMIEWLGPILYEYYAGSEGGGGFVISSEEWLRKPGSVGRRPNPEGTKILDEAGRELPAGETGTVYFKQSPLIPFQYYKDPAKTAAAHRNGYFTLGDIGYLDADDYLFLTGRSAEIIISGGVNIYPQEIDNELLKHPAVEDSCVIGAPNAEWGEEVKAVILPKPGFAPSEALAAELIAFARAHVAGYKVPRSVEFVSELPRNPAGKIERKKVRAKYWEGRKVQI